MILFQTKRDICHIKMILKILILKHIESALSNGGSIMFIAISL